MMDKPEKKFNYYRYDTGVKNCITDPQRESTLYRFYLRDDASKELIRSVSVADDSAVHYSGGGIIELVEDLIGVFKTYIYASAQKELPELLTYLKCQAAADFLDKLAYDVALAEYNLEQATEAHRAAVKAASYYEDGRATYCPRYHTVDGIDIDTEDGSDYCMQCGEPVVDGKCTWTEEKADCRPCKLNLAALEKAKKEAESSE